MKTASVSLLLGVSVLLLLSGLTVSAVSLNVSPNLQQFFTKDPPVSLSCVEDGQTIDGWTVKRTREEQTEECGAAGSDFGRLDGSSCVLDLTKPFTTVYWCETSSGQSSDQVTITVTDALLILEIPALPVLTGSDVTLSCRNRNDDTVEAYFFFNANVSGLTVPEFTISKVQQSDEGLYSCSNNELGKSPQSRLRVRDHPTTSDPHTTATFFNNPDPSDSSTVTSPLSVIRLCLHVLVFCPYCICTVLMMWICCGRKTGKNYVVSMEMTQCDEDYDDIIADVTAEHNLRAVH